MNYEDVRMRNIENIYTDYNGLVDEITEEAIKNRIKQFQAEMQAFIDSNKYSKIKKLSGNRSH